MKLCRLGIRKYLGVIEIFAYNKDISQYSALHQSGECRPVLPGWSQSGCWAGGPMAAQHQITWTTSTANQSQPPLLIVFSMQHMECSHSSTNPRACSATWWWFWPTAAKYFCISSFLLQHIPSLPSLGETQQVCSALPSCNQLEIIILSISCLKSRPWQIILTWDFFMISDQWWR